MKTIILVKLLVIVLEHQHHQNIYKITLIEIFRLTTYGATFVSWSSKSDDSCTNFGSGGDVISILDQGSIQTRTNTYNPLTNHQDTNFQDQGKEPIVGEDPVKLVM